MPNSLPQAIKDYVNESQKNIHTSIPGKIKSFDAQGCTATIEISGKYKKPDGTYINYPDITEVPVCLIQSSGQNCGIAYPIKEGDGVMVMFSEQQLDQWRDDEQPDTDLRFDLSSGMAICGLCKDGNDKMQGACDNDEVVLYNGDNATITVKEDNIKIRMQNSSIVIDNDGKITITAESEVVIDAEKTTVNGNLGVVGSIVATGVVYGVADVQSPTHSLIAQPTPSPFPPPFIPGE